MNAEVLIRRLSARPVIAAVREEAEVDGAADSPVAAVFLLGGSILTLPGATSRLRQAGKTVFVHLDLCEGLGRDEAAVRWCVKNLAMDGLISTRSQLLRAAASAGLATIQRMFLMDSASLENGVKLMRGNPPTLVELLPGVAPKAIRLVRQRLDIPVIAGGMVTDEVDVRLALEAGALAVSSSEKRLWGMDR